MAGTSKANQRQSKRGQLRYQAYRNSATREKNKAYRLIRHLERQPKDKTAVEALEALPEYCVTTAKNKLKALRMASKGTL